MHLFCIMINFYATKLKFVSKYKNNLPNNIQFFFVPNLSTIIPTIGVDMASTICPVQIENSNNNN